MRRSCPTASLPARPTTSFLALALVSAAGCQQANGPNGGTALTPVSPLAPHGSSSAAGPQLGPFGGSTRVAPPGTGSYGTANNYLGGVAPVNATSQNFAPANAASGYVAATPGSQVQPVGWTETQSVAPDFARGNSLASGNAGGMVPRLDGMPVNDFTRAPAPPGYPTRQPSLASNPWGVHSVPDRTGPHRTGPHRTDPRRTGAPQSAAGQFGVARGASYAQAGVDPADTSGVPSPPELRASTAPPRLQPMPATKSDSTPARFQAMPESFPSTEPTGQTDAGRSADSRGSDADLPWRAPTPRY